MFHRERRWIPLPEALKNHREPQCPEQLSKDYIASCSPYSVNFDYDSVIWTSKMRLICEGGLGKLTAQLFCSGKQRGLTQTRKECGRNAWVCSSWLGSPVQRFCCEYALEQETTSLVNSSHYLFSTQKLFWAPYTPQVAVTSEITFLSGRRRQKIGVIFFFHHSEAR